MRGKGASGRKALGVRVSPSVKIKLMHMMDENLDLVDENDNVIGQKKRSEIYAENFSNFRVINVFIINSQG